MSIFAKVKLPKNADKVNQVWQVGPSVTDDGKIEAHEFAPTNMDSKGVLNLKSGQSLSSGGDDSRTKQKNIHGVLNAVSWGYAIGVSGWAIGLKLGNESQGIQHTGHRNIGIAVFCLATLQVLALMLRPNKDHRYRFWWNMYHRSVGYTTIILGIINIFGGFNILSPQRTWKVAYVAALGALAVIALLLEFFTWIVFCMRKSQGNATINILTIPPSY
ncbi:hypothetical protein K1719_046304 [Acacia pycnantha]|nr:hypothetical protein K1719_046304 [Acacia pycnantha]